MNLNISITITHLIGQITAENCEFRSNLNAAIYIQSTSTLLVNSSRFYDNKANAGGKNNLRNREYIIFLLLLLLLLLHTYIPFSFFFLYHSHYIGGGIRSVSGSSLTILNSFFFRNHMAFYHASGPLTVTGNSFYDK